MAIGGFGQTKTPASAFYNFDYNNNVAIRQYGVGQPSHIRILRCRHMGDRHSCSSLEHPTARQMEMDEGLQMKRTHWGVPVLTGMLHSAVLKSDACLIAES